MTVTIGVEEEFDLVDPETRLPAADAERVIAASARLGLDVTSIVNRGTSADRQRAAGSLPDAVDQLVAETRSGL